VTHGYDFAATVQAAAAAATHPVIAAPLIISRQSDGVIDLELHTRQPMVYLDNWAMSRVLANNGPRRKRFVEIFKVKGTLLFSWANVLELPHYEPIRVLFEGIGEHWFPLEWNPFACIRKENALKPGDNTPVFSETFIQAYYPHIHGQSPTLSSVLDLLRLDSGGKARRDKIKGTIKQFVDEVKRGHSTDPDWLDKKYPLLPFDPQRPTLFVFTQLLRALASEGGFTFTPNDGVDLFHTAVPVAYSDFVLLDKAWARRARAVSMPDRRFYAFYGAEIDQFLDAFENCQIVPSP
jgi:hypothetical protein